MADRTFESQQFASQEAARGEAALSGGIAALGGAAQAAGAALERHADRAAQREQAQATIEMQRADLQGRREDRRDEMAYRREALDVNRQQGDAELQFRRGAQADEMSYKRDALGEGRRQADAELQARVQHQNAQLQLSARVEQRLAEGQASDIETRQLRTKLEWEQAAQNQLQFMQQFALDKEKVNVMAQTKLLAAQAKQIELNNRMMQIQIEQQEANSSDAYQRGKLRGQSLEMVAGAYEASATLLQKMSDSVGMDPEVVSAVRDRMTRMGEMLDGLMAEQTSGDPDIGPPRQPRPRQPRPTTGKVSGREIDYDGLNQFIQGVAGSLRDPGASISDKVIANSLFRSGKDGKVEVADPLTLKSYQEALADVVTAMPKGEATTSDIAKAFNRQVADMMTGRDMTFDEAVSVIRRQQ